MGAWRLFTTRRAPSEAGFTLMELLVALALMALVIAVLAVGFRTGIQSWRRLGEESAALEILSAVPAALQRDLDFWTGLRPYGGAGTAGRVLRFCGTAHAVAFWTRYAPEGAAFQGVHLVAYIHDASAQELLVYRVRVALDDDPDALTRRILEGDPTFGIPVGRVPGVGVFSLTYAEAGVPGEGSSGSEEAFQWVDGWDCEQRDSPPKRIRLTVGVTRGSRLEGGTWTLTTGIPQL